MYELWKMHKYIDNAHSCVYLCMRTYRHTCIHMHTHTHTNITDNEPHKPQKKLNPLLDISAFSLVSTKISIKTYLPCISAALLGILWYFLTFFTVNFDVKHSTIKNRFGAKQKNAQFMSPIHTQWAQLGRMRQNVKNIRPHF